MIRDELIKLSTPKKSFSFQLALINLGLGNEGVALDYLERSFQEHGTYMMYLKVDPYLDSLRTHERFIKMLDQMGLSRALSTAKLT